jgi:hypothetical protein
VLKLSGGARAKNIVGVVSTSAGVILNTGGAVQSGGDTSSLITKNSTVMGLAGELPTKVSTENGPIEVGDLITSSSVPGVGMKADPGDSSVGLAMEAYNSAGVGKINVLISRDNGADKLVAGLKTQVDQLNSKYASLEKRVAELETLLKK